MRVGIRNQKVNNEIYSRRAQAAKTTAAGSKSKTAETVTGFDPNKKYKTVSEMKEDLKSLEKSDQIQYKKTIASSDVKTEADLKAEIKKMFPEYRLVSQDPKKVVNGENLLYIDDANMQKMLKDPEYRSEVYALMKRELTGNDGYHLGGNAWKQTGSVFSLSNSNPVSDGIPYAGMSTSMKLPDTYQFPGGSTDTQAAGSENSSKSSAGKNKKSVGELFLENFRKRQLEQRQKIRSEMLKPDTHNRKTNMEYTQNAALKKYQEQFRYK